MRWEEGEHRAGRSHGDKMDPPCRKRSMNRVQAYFKRIHVLMGRSFSRKTYLSRAILTRTYLSERPQGQTTRSPSGSGRVWSDTYMPTTREVGLHIFPALMQSFLFEAMKKRLFIFYSLPEGLTNLNRVFCFHFTLGVTTPACTFVFSDPPRCLSPAFLRLLLLWEVIETRNA